MMRPNRARVQPRASVIIPAYNHANFIVTTVRSVLDQTYPNIEIIVVDDGSSDGSAACVQSAFANTVQLIRQTNRGPSAALNTGIAAATGEYIVLLGGDDVCLPHRIDYQIELLERTNSDGVFCRPMLVDAAGKRLPNSDSPEFFRSDLEKEIALHALFFQGNFLCAPSAMLRAPLFKQLGLMHEGLIQLQDYEFWMRACSQGLKLRLSDRSLVQYRRHAGNLSHRTVAAVATAAELPLVLLRTLKHGDPAVLRRAFQHLLPLTLDVAVALSDFEITLILLAHPRQEVRDRGMERVFNLLDDHRFMRSRVAQHVNMFRFAYNMAGR